MTTEQIIVIGFIVAAFLAGWIASLVTRRRARSPDALPPPSHTVEAVTEPAQAERAAAGETPPLAEEVGHALRSDAANDGMMSVVRADQDAALSELELDLADWGFTYGVAWARAREREPAGLDDAVAAEALEAAERVFRAYIHPMTNATEAPVATETPADASATAAKWWGNSMTIWGAAVTALSTVVPVVAPLVGLDITPEVVRKLGEQSILAVQAVGGLAGTILTIYGRMRATTALERRQIKLTL